MRYRLRDLGLRDALVIFVPLAFIVVAGFWAAAQFIRPAPPREIVMTTGGPGGAYQMFGARYKTILEGYGIKVIEKPSEGAIENLRRLMDPQERVDAGFVQGGLGMGTDIEGLVSLGSFYYEPLWVFYRGSAEIPDIAGLKGKRIAIGHEGSGTRHLAIELITANGIQDLPTRLESFGGTDAVAALAAGKVDAIFLVGPVNSAAVWTALFTPGLRLMSMARADAYVRRFPYLARLDLPEGAIDLVRSVPNRDVTLIAPMATMVVREDTHPALIDLLLRAATQIHGQPGIFQRAGEFPNRTQVDFPLSREAERFYTSGTRFLQRYLPFWAATLVDRLIVMLIPVIALLIPAMKILPVLYGWRVRSRIYRWYGELKFLEREIDADPGSRSPSDWLTQLDAIEAQVHRVKTPNAYSNQLYILREHINLVRRTVQRRLAGEKSAAPAMAEDAV
jgi:TRAP transporter TAXI family solute receptor